MDCAENSSATADPGIDVIERIGVSTITKEFGTNKRAVRMWRQRGSISDDRCEYIRHFLEALPEQFSAVAEVSTLVTTVSPEHENAAAESILYLRCAFKPCLQ